MTYLNRARAITALQGAAVLLNEASGELHEYEGQGPMALLVGGFAQSVESLADHLGEGT